MVREQVVFEALVTVFLTHRHGEGLLLLRTAVLARNLVVAHNAERRLLERTLFKQFHIYREHAVAPEVRSLLRVHHRSVIARHIEAAVLAEHRKRIRRHKDRRQRRCLIEDIGTDNLVTRVHALAVGTAAENRRRRNAERLRHQGAVRSRFRTARFATRARGERHAHRTAVEARLRNRCFRAQGIAVRSRGRNAPCAGFVLGPSRTVGHVGIGNRVEDGVLAIRQVKDTAIFGLERGMRFMAAVTGNVRRHLDGRRFAAFGFQREGGTRYVVQLGLVFLDGHIINAFFARTAEVLAPVATGTVQAHANLVALVDDALEHELVRLAQVRIARRIDHERRSRTATTAHHHHATGTHLHDATERNTAVFAEAD